MFFHKKTKFKTEYRDKYLQNILAAFPASAGLSPCLNHIPLFRVQAPFLSAWLKPQPCSCSCSRFVPPPAAPALIPARVTAPTVDEEHILIGSSGQWLVAALAERL